MTVDVSFNVICGKQIFLAEPGHRKADGRTCIFIVTTVSSMVSNLL